MISKKDLMEDIARLEMLFEEQSDDINDLNKRLKKLEKEKKSVKVSK